MSLRTAIALSLKEAEESQKDTTSSDNNSTIAMQSNTNTSTSSTPNNKKKTQQHISAKLDSVSTPGSSSKAAHTRIEIPHQKLTKCIRNNIPSQIDTHGFVELSNILPPQLLTNIKNHAITKMNNDSDIEIISNALQIDLSKELFHETKVNLVKNEIIDETMKFVYGQPPPPSPAASTTEATSSLNNGDILKTSHIAGTSEGETKLSTQLNKEQSQTSVLDIDKLATLVATGGVIKPSIPEKEKVSTSNSMDIDTKESNVSTAMSTTTMDIEMKDSLLEKSTIEPLTNEKQAPVSVDATSPGNNIDEQAKKKQPTSSNYKGYIIETPKILVALPGSAPQLPHADDHCTSCIICLLHLGDGQEPTRVATYDKMKDFPTGITVTCDKCNRNEMLPDHDYRRGVHLTNESWSCNCKGPWKPYDFEGKLVTAFSELLERGAPDLCDSYCGKEDTKMGDGYLALPTLIHRGPGNASSSAEPRYMLFFTLRPQYSNTTSLAAHYHKYNVDLQIHAATVLFNQFNKVKKVYAGSGCDVAGRFGTVVSRDCSKILGENEVLSEENASMRAILEDMNVAVPAPKKLSSPAATTSSKKKRKEKDENEELAYEPVEITHNDSCEVCGTGGDLICCSTCNLVFHLGCTRPQLTEVPEGNWNCAYCVAENPPELEVTPQALEEAKRGVEEMDAEKAKHKPLRGKQAKRQKMMNAEEVRNEPPAKKHKLNKLKTNASIFVGGLHVNTDEETLRRHFGKYGEIIAVEIMRNAAGTPRGFGFIEFLSDDVVEAALQNEPHVINCNIVSIENSSDIVGFFSSKGKKKNGEDEEDDSSSDAFDSSLGQPKRLAYKDDSGEVNKLHQYVRKELLEIFAVGDKGEMDDESSGDEDSDDKDERDKMLGAVKKGASEKKNDDKADTRNLVTTKHYPGRVGLRCVHCARAKSTSKAARKSSFYPLRLSNIYREVCAWQRLHFKKCSHIPEGVRKRYEHFKSIDTSRGKTRYWETSAAKIGLKNNPKRDDGVVFAKTLCKPKLLMNGVWKRAVSKSV